MGTILLIVFKFSTSSTTNHFSVFPTELKDRFPLHLAFVVVVVTFSALYP